MFQPLNCFRKNWSAIYRRFSFIARSITAVEDLCQRCHPG